jgi:cbb3-type cytochrome oxidase subunit 1
MRGISFWFFFTATLYVLTGMIWGIVMAATEDHSLFPAHAHLNLLGWVTMALFGVYYHLVPRKGTETLSKIHFAIATCGLVLMVPGIVLALTDRGHLLATIGALLSLASMVLFSVTVLRDRQA